MTKICGADQPRLSKCVVICCLTSSIRGGSTRSALGEDHGDVRTTGKGNKIAVCSIVCAITVITKRQLIRREKFPNTGQHIRKETFHDRGHRQNQ